MTLPLLLQRRREEIQSAKCSLRALIRVLEQIEQSEEADKQERNRAGAEIKLATTIQTEVEEWLR